MGLDLIYTIWMEGMKMQLELTVRLPLKTFSFLNLLYTINNNNSYPSTSCCEINLTHVLEIVTSL